MNSAKRLLALYDALAKQGADRPMSDVWAEIFQLNASNDIRDRLLRENLHALLDELELTRSVLTTRYEVPTDLLSPGFTRLADAAHPGRMFQNWGGIKGNIQPPENRQAFAWSAWVMREAIEPDIDSQALGELHADLQSLEGALRETEMPLALRNYIQRQVDSIRRALRLYKVQGIRPLNEAMQQALGEVVVSRESLNEMASGAKPEAKSLLKKTLDSLQKVGEVCDSVNKVTTTGEHIALIASKFGPLINSLPLLGS